MKATARYNETVGRFLFRIFGEDSDEVEAKFYSLNPSLVSLFLENGKEYEVPEVNLKKEVASQKIEVWE